jgi:small subunit ribosomal protein S4
MSKRISAKYRASRQLGVNLWGRAKDPVEIKNYVPGQHGPAGKRRVVSDYGKQLAAKQKLKKYYGNITEKQFRKIYTNAVRKKGDTSENLIGLLETRLDAIVYRAKFVPTVFSSRQLISHKHISVNGQKVNIASYTVSVGDIIQIREKSLQLPMVMAAMDSPERDIPDFLEVDNKKGTIKVLRVPKPSEVPYPTIMEPNLVIEFYSR